jgi:hypothetical protein
LKQQLHGGLPEPVDAEMLRRENEELQRKNRELEAKVVELTAALAKHEREGQVSRLCWKFSVFSSFLTGRCSMNHLTTTLFHQSTMFAYDVYNNYSKLLLHYVSR